MTWEHKPGSNDAVLNGCRCPMLDNNYGEGRNGLFITNGDCPLHGVRVTDEDCANIALVWVILSALLCAVGVLALGVL